MIRGSIYNTFCIAKTWSVHDTDGKILFGDNVQKPPTRLMESIVQVLYRNIVSYTESRFILNCDRPIYVVFDCK